MLAQTYNTIVTSKHRNILPVMLVLVLGPGFNDTLSFQALGPGPCLEGRVLFNITVFYKACYLDFLFVLCHRRRITLKADHKRTPCVTLGNQYETTKRT